MNAGVAIFTLLASQLIGYGMAGMLTDIVVKPSYSIFPAKISLANTFQALHFDGGLGTKRTKFFWGVFAFMFVYESEYCKSRPLPLSPLLMLPPRYQSCLNGSSPSCRPSRSSAWSTTPARSSETSLEVEVTTRAWVCSAGVSTGTISVPTVCTCLCRCS